MRPSRHSSRGEGFTLIETLVALTLLAVAMLLTLSLIFQEPRALHRIAAHQQAFRALEQTLEAIRAGHRVPPGRAPVDPSELLLPDEPAALDLQIWSELESVSGSGLFHLTLTARYRAGRQWYTRHLETLVWFP